MADYANSNNIAFCYNLASESIKDTDLFKILEYSDFLFCNKQEAIAFSSKYGEALNLGLSKNEENLALIALAMSKLAKKNLQRPRAVIITDSIRPVTFVAAR